MADLFEVNCPRLYIPSGPSRDKKYLAFIRSLRFCLACGRWGKVQAAHTGPHGLGQKASDYDAVPLCADCHEQLDKKLGPAQFQEEWGITFRVHIEKLNLRYFRMTKRAA